MYKVESMIESKMQMDVAPFLDIPAQTFTFTACFGAGFNSLFVHLYSDLFCMPAQLHCTLVCPNDVIECITRRYHFFCKCQSSFASEIMGPNRL